MDIIYRVLLGFNLFYLDITSFTKNFHWVLSSFTEFYQIYRI